MFAKIHNAQFSGHGRTRTVRERAREFIEELIRSELDAALGRPRYERSKQADHEGTPGMTGHRHGSRPRSLTGSFGPIEIAVPRARLNTADGRTTEWKSQSLRAYSAGRWWLTR